MNDGRPMVRRKKNKGRKIIIRNDVEVRFNEVDLYRIVHNSHYYNYFDIGRIEFINRIFRKAHDYGAWHFSEPYGFLVLKSACKFMNFAKLGDRLRIETVYHYYPWQKNARIELHHRIKNRLSRKTVAEGITEIGVCSNDFNLFYLMPDDLLEEIHSSIEYYRSNAHSTISIV